MYTYSLEHKNYLKKLKKEKRIVIFFQIIIVFLFLISWQILSDMNIINNFLSSSPTKVFNTIIDLFKDGSLFKHISVTLYEVIISFIISVIISLIISTILWLKPIISKIIDPYLTVLNSLPKVALGPLIIIWVGASTNSIIFMSLLISTFITIINIYTSFLNTDKSYITLLRSLGASNKQIFFKVILPSNYYNIINALKINISMNLIGVIMGELLVSKKGLGYLIMYGSQTFNINLVLTSVVILAIISYLMYFIIDKIEAKKRLK
ncbi:MAG: ABC transporter permease [Bacilli bacterium]|nr:ABC transporter permease [Bacilli bacterium]